jgi:hypothetical protein
MAKRKAQAGGPQGRAAQGGIAMAETYDLILKGGIVVNQEKAVLPRSATCRVRTRARPSIAAACISCPA